MTEIFCRNCNNVINETIKELENLNPTPCPFCGSNERLVQMFAVTLDTLNIKEKVRAKVKNEELKSKDKLRKDITSGDDFFRKSGKWNKLKRIIDKDLDYYKEVITDSETNELIRYCEEPLSKHQGRGSAKNTKNTE